MNNYHSNDATSITFEFPKNTELTPKDYLLNLSSIFDFSKTGYYFCVFNRIHLFLGTDSTTPLTNNSPDRIRAPNNPIERILATGEYASPQTFLVQVLLGDAANFTASANVQASTSGMEGVGTKTLSTVINVRICAYFSIPLSTSATVVTEVLNDSPS